MARRGTRSGGTPRRLSAVALVIAVGAGTTVAGAATPHDVSSSPPDFAAITCKGPSFCFAVGITASATFAARYDGAVWTSTPMPVVTNGKLTGVACSSSTNCFAIGSRGPSDKRATLIERWDGSSWKIVSSPNRSGSNQLASISCVSASFCVAVGSRLTRIGSDVTLVEHWNGKAWKIVSSPNFHGGSYDVSVLTGIACTTAKHCFAVGSTVLGDSRYTFIIRWNGRAWSISARQHSTVAQSINLNGVACSTATACMAVGRSDVVFKAATDRWNGSKWTLREPKGPPNDPYRDHELNAVACSSANACLAVGSLHTVHPYAKRWNGSSWKETAQPQRSESVYGFAGVACVAADRCYAVGGNVVEEFRPGHWTTVATF